MKQEALIGRTIAGKYEIESLVGQGAMGAVYKARQVTLGTTLAIKVLHRQLAGEPMFAARFLREAQAASRVDHPSSMRVVDFGEEHDGLLYIAMEYVDGKTLAQIIDEDGPLPVTRIVDIACQALAALAVAHDIGVIHRDLKPENIMVIEGQDDEGRTHDIVKVCDFGVAKLLQGGARAPSVTAKGLVVGTPEYMSPEQARGDTLDARSDLYAMGVLLFHLMTGKVPFDSSTAFGTAFMHVNDEPTRPRLLNPRVDSRLEKICLKAMRKRPEDRYASARELRTELRALLGHEDEESASLSRPTGPAMTGGLLQQMQGRPRRTGLFVAGAVGVAACALATGLVYPRLAENPEPRELVQSATIASAVLPVQKAPLAAPAVAVAVAEESPSTAASTSTVPPDAPARTPSSRAHVAPKPTLRRAVVSGAKARTGASAVPSVPAKATIGEEGSPTPLLPGPNAPPDSSSLLKHSKVPGPSAPTGAPEASPASRPVETGEGVTPPKGADPEDLPLPVFPVPAVDPAP